MKIKRMEWKENDEYYLLREYEYIIQKFNLIPFTSEMPQNNIKSRHSANSYESILSNKNYVTCWGKRNSRISKTEFLLLVNSESNGEGR